MSKQTPPRFNLGDRVKVTHPRDGTWEGRVIWRAFADKEMMWEYEVTGAPRMFEGHYRPLAWEGEITFLHS
jgi:hypothetical protein